MFGLARPLEGIRVLTIENFVAGPFCSMWLADAGAEVIKIEEPGKGDLSRTTSPTRPDETGTPCGLSFLRTNRNKKSVTLDLKNPEGKSIFTGLARQADIVIENLRPGVMNRLGLGYEVLAQENPGLVYVAISGFGQSGPLQSPFMDRPAFDIVAQALSGLMYRPERTGDRPVYLGFSLGDLQAGIVAAYGAMLALIQRGRNGKGQLVDISLYDASMVMNEISIAIYSVFQQTPPPGLHAVTAPFGTYATQDGHVVIAVLGDHIWHRFCDVIDQPGLATDPRFADGISRRRAVAEMDAIILPWMQQRTRQQVIDAMLAGGVPASVVHDVPDLFDCPHLKARNMLMTLDDPVWGRVAVAGNPIKMSAVPDIQADLPPRLGQHTDEVLKSWLRVEDSDLRRLRENGAL